MSFHAISFRYGIEQLIKKSSQRMLLRAFLQAEDRFEITGYTVFIIV